VTSLSRQQIEERIQAEGTNLSLAGEDLSGLDLSNLELSGSDFSGANLKGVNLKDAQLRDTNLSGANLEEANLSKANLSKANFSQARLDGANLSNAYLLQANLSEVNLSGLNLSLAKLDGVIMSGANLQGANLDRAFAIRANLRQANLSQANLSQADFKNADLSEANLTEANMQATFLEGANLGGTDLRQAKCQEANLRLSIYDEQTRWDNDFDPVAAGAVRKKKKKWLGLFLLVTIGMIFILSACQAKPDEAPTAIPSPTRPITAPRNENVEALNAAQAALAEVDFGFAPLLLDDEARIIIETQPGVEIARLTYPQQPADPAAWATVDSFVSAYGVRQVLLGSPQVGRVALGMLTFPASVGQAAENVEHIAAWVTFADRSRAIVDLTPLSTNFAPRHTPGQMLTDPNQLEAIFTDRRTGVLLNQLQPMTTIEQDDQLYYLLAKVIVSYDSYEFSLRTHPVKPADPMTPMEIRPGASVGVKINRDEFAALQKLLIEDGLSAFDENPNLLLHDGSTDQTLIEIQNEHLDLLWHLITKFEHQPPDSSIPTATPTITPTPSPTLTPIPTATPRRLPLVTS